MLLVMEKLSSLPNLIYTDGNAFSLWQDGELVDSVIRVTGDIESSGSELQAPHDVQGHALRCLVGSLRWGSH